jgi:hypothetical protein
MSFRSASFRASTGSEMSERPSCANRSNAQKTTVSQPEYQRFLRPREVHSRRRDHDQRIRDSKDGAARRVVHAVLVVRSCVDRRALKGHSPK